MARSKTTRDRLLQGMASHVLANGLAVASLRPLAKSAGTSDRMLIYHFGSKNGLIAELLEHLSADLRQKLDAALPARRSSSSRQLVAEIVALLRRQPYVRYAQVWFEIASAASRGSEIHQIVGRKIAEAYLDWIARRIPEKSKDPRAAAAMLLTLIEGVLILDAVGQRAMADKALAHFFRVEREL